MPHAEVLGKKGTISGIFGTLDRHRTLMHAYGVSLP